MAKTLAQFHMNCVVGY